MGRRSVLEPYQTIIDGDMTDNIESQETITKNLDKLTFEVSWAGVSPVGEIFIDRKVKNEWESLDFGASIEITGNTGVHQIEINRPADSIKIRYVATSGSGTLNVWLSGSVVGA